MASVVFFVATFLAAFASADQQNVLVPGRSGNALIKNLKPESGFLAFSSAEAPSESSDVSFLTANKDHSKLVFYIADSHDGIEQSFTSSAAVMPFETAIESTFYPQDPVSRLTTLMTGVTPNEHLIVSKEWINNEGYKTAYYPGALRASGALSDHLTKQSNGQSFVFSASSDFQMASAAGVHQMTHVKYNSDRVFGVSLENNAFESIYPVDDSQEFTVSRKEVAQFVASFAMPENDEFEVTSAGDRLIVTDKTGAKHIFSLHHDYDLLAEFALINKFAKKSKEQLKQFATDEHPDLFVFTVAGLKSVHGASSKKAAVALTDYVVSSAVKHFNGLYSGDITSHLIFNGKSSKQQLVRSLPESVRRHSYYAVQDNLYSRGDYDRFFPFVYFRHSSDSDVSCEYLEEAFQSADVEVVCYNPSTKYARRADNNTVTVGPDPGTFSEKDYATYQITLWMAVLLILAVYGAIYAIYAMDTGEDSLLYRMTNLKEHQL